MTVTALDTQELNDLFYGTAREWSPEQKLMVAVLRDAICCLVGFRPFGGARERLAREAVAWIQSGEWYLYSFNSVCAVLGIDPAYLRRALGKELKLVSTQRFINRGRRKVHVPDWLEYGYSHAYESSVHCPECRQRFDRSARHIGPAIWRAPVGRKGRVQDI